MRWIPYRDPAKIARQDARFDLIATCLLATGAAAAAYYDHRTIAAPAVLLAATAALYALLCAIAVSRRIR